MSLKGTFIMLEENLAQSAMLKPGTDRLARFAQLSAIPTEYEWFANITNPQTRRAYKNDLNGFMTFTGITEPSQFRDVLRVHVIAWRNDLVARGVAPATLRRKLAALSSLFNYLCEQNAVLDNPTLGVKRVKENSHEGKTPALSDSQARLLLDMPSENTLKGKRDRAVLSTLLYHGLRRAELCKLRVEDMQVRQGINHFRVHGKGGKIRYIPVHYETARRIDDYLVTAGHGTLKNAALFRPVIKTSAGEDPGHSIAVDTVYRRIVIHYLKQAGMDLNGLCPHALRATAGTNALEHGADLAEVQTWMGHSQIQTTRLYDKRRQRPEDSPTLKIRY